MSPFIVSLPVFLIIAIGWLFKKYRIVNEVWVHILNSFAYYVSLPALIVVSFWGVDFLSSDVQLIVRASILLTVIFSGIVLLALSLAPFSKKLKVALFLVATTGNTVYMGFPILSNALGDVSLRLGTVVAVVYLVVPILLSIFVIRWWIGKDHSLAHQLGGFIKNPLVLSIIAGIGISFIPKHWVIMQVIGDGLSMLALTASPVALFVLGAFLYKRFLRRHVGLVIGISVIKVAMFPALVWLLMGFDSFPLIAPILFLLAAMPAAVTTFVIAEQFDLDAGFVGNVLLVSTVLSFFAIPLAVSLL